jgi:hypothetical protein
MYGNRRFSAAAQRSAERRERENQAPRLSAEVPRLLNLKLEVEERLNDSPVAEPKHVKRVVVEHAPALFLLPCGDSRCDQGGHDVTHAIMRCLKNGEQAFDGDDSCHGSTGGAPCNRTLHYHATAEYKPS